MARSPKRPTMKADRLVYFTDAVVAIAITLLVLPLVELVPEAVARHEAVSELVTHNLGPIGAFLLSFVVISRLWMSHHSAFDGIERVDHRMIWLDLVWLLTIVVLPFPTALTGGRGSDPLTVQLYIGTLAVNMVTLAVLAYLVHREYGDLGTEAAQDLVRGLGSAAVMSLVAFVVVLVAPSVSFWSLLLLFASPLAERIWRSWLARRSAG